MSIILISIFLIIAVIGFIMWRNWKIARVDRTSEATKQQAYLNGEEKRTIRAEAKIQEQRKAREQRAEMYGTERKTQEERKLKEEELRRKIDDAEKHKAEEEKPKIE